jgi:hypothetical protein|tara:strand:+ start:336 stop:869 length:534 start_codon:yes stop_codon:yes gene_type:complete
MKLKSQCRQKLIEALLTILNEDKLPCHDIKYPAQIYEELGKSEMYPSDKEAYIINSLPSCIIAQKALLAYQCREAMGYINATLAFTMETAEFSVDFFNDYSLSLRGRTTQGVTLFKNQILAMVDGSKKKSTKPEVTESQTKMNIPKTFNLHGQLADKSMDYCISLQHEINSDEASIF